MGVLISVADKNGIEPFARELSTRGYEIIATEGTAQVQREAACRAGNTAIIQPADSIRYAEAIRTANRYGVAMDVVGQRHLRH